MTNLVLFVAGPAPVRIHEEESVWHHLGSASHVITSNTIWMFSRQVLATSLLVCLLCWQPGAAAGSGLDNADFHFQRHTQADGISQGFVTAIEQDRAGFLWVGTQDGLNRFDGHQFAVFHHDPFDSTSLGHNQVLCLCADSEGNLWIGTPQGVNLLSPDQLGFRQFRQVSGDETSRLNGRIKCLHRDREGQLWIGTNTGLVCFDPVTEQSTLFQHDSTDTTSLTCDRVSSLCEDSRGRLWIGTENGINLHDPTSGRFQRYYPDTADSTSDGNSIWTISEVAEGLLWFGASPGLWSLDVATGKVAPVAVKDSYGLQIENELIRGIQRDSLGRIWLASFDHGVWLLEPDATEAIRLQHDPHDSGSLSHSSSTRLFRDRSDVIWIGTSGYGLNSWSPYRCKFEKVAKIAGDPNSLHFRSVRSCYEDPSGAVWIGGYGGMDRRDPVTGVMSHVSGVELGNVYTILGDPDQPDQLLWIGTEGCGLMRYDQMAQSLKEYPHDETGDESLAGNIVYALTAGSTGQLWLGTQDGLSRFDRENELFTLVHATTPGSAVRAICFDGRGTLWLGTMDGVARLDSLATDPVYYRHDPHDPSGLSNDHVLCVHEDSRDGLWFGTNGGGLNRFDRDQQTFEHYLKRDGLPNNVVYGILEAADGKLWLSTNQGISCFDPVAETFRNFIEDDGLQDLEFNASAYHHGQSGAFYFGGVAGVTVIRPDRLLDDPNPAPVVLTDFLLFNRSVPVSSGPDQRRLLTRPIEATDRLTLSYLDRLVTFEFAALNFTAPLRNRFAYRLQGLDPEWSDLGHRRYVTFTDLKPGEYQLEIRATNADGLWSNASSSLTLVITPPVWETRWFRIGGVLVFGGFMIGLHRRRTVNIRRRNVELKRSRQFLDSIINALDDPVFVKDEQLRWVVLNDRACEMLGRPREELLGKNPHEVLSDSWADDFQALDQEILRDGGTVVSEVDVVWSGEPRIVSAKKSVFTERGTGKRYIAGSIRDITEIKQAETALRANEARLKSIFRAAPVGVGLAVDRVFVEVNETFCEMTGFTSTELQGQSARILYDNDEDFQKAGDELHRQINDSGIASLEVNLLRQNGSRFEALFCAAPVVLGNSAAGLTFTVQDITRRKSMERDLRLTRFTVDHGGD
ncbi:MAG: two-component regulator propeller domain-containing protein, partial [bacterium]